MRATPCTARRRWLFGALLALATNASAERLPIRAYTTADGLAHDRVSRMLADSRGFLWFCTPSGLSRFDGQRFVTYLARQDVTDIAEDKGGNYWVSVSGRGLLRLDARAREERDLLHELPWPPGRWRADSRGRMWNGSGQGLYVVDPASSPGEARRVDLGAELRARPRIWDVVVDRQDQLWIASATGKLLTRSPDGDVAERSLVPGRLPASVRSLLEDREGRVWAGHDLGVTRFDPRNPGRPTWYGPDDIGSGIVLDLIQSADGTIWLARHGRGLTSFDGKSFRQHTEADGIPSLPHRLAEDRAGNLWIGTYDAGALRIGRSGITAYDANDGLAFSRYASVLEDRTGRIVVAAGDALYAFDGRKFQTIRPAVLRGLDSGRQAENPVVLQDRRGRWWLGTRDGLYRFASQPVEELARAAPEAVFNRENGLPGTHVFRLFEDSRGDVWIALYDAPGPSRWDATTDAVRHVRADDGGPTSFAKSFAEDRAGNVWVGLQTGLVRQRADRTAFERIDGFEPARRVDDLYLDRNGRLWIASLAAGVDSAGDPTAERPVFERVDGMPDDRASCVIEDRQGRVFVCTVSGVLRIDPSGHRRTLTTADGLSSNETRDAVLDRDGALWFTSVQGVSRFRPRVEPERSPEVWIAGLRLGGQAYPTAALGETQLGEFRLGSQSGGAEIEFGSFDFALGQGTRYRYRLAGAGSRWSDLGKQRAVTYASLAPGRYRFEVQAVDAEGRTSAVPASVAFRVLAPVWRRWWFVALSGIAVGGAAFLGYRYRIEQTLQLERLRTRIATDLHDDIGSSLSQVAILSEVVQRRVGDSGAEIIGPLTRIADASREVVDSMGDIVWAVDPARDRFVDVVHRMRRFASDTLAARGIELRFATPAMDGTLLLGPEVRREIYLVFKEALHNAVKHAQCRSVEVDVAVAQDSFRLSVRDDGRGLSENAGHGHGLANMARRAQRLGGSLTVEARPGDGTQVRLLLPLRRRRRWRHGRPTTR